MVRNSMVGRSGPPTICSECRTPFQTSLVGSSKRKKMINLLCPRCLVIKKTKRKAQKSNG